MKSKIKFEDSVIDVYEDEKYKLLTLNVDNKTVGYIEYSVYEDEPNIKYIEVNEESRRKGYGKKMIEKLQSMYPDSEINFGMLTDDGSKLYKSLDKEITINSDFDKKVKHLEKINNWLKKYGKIAKKDIEDWTDEDLAYLRKYADIWQKYHNKQQDIENWLNNHKRQSVKIKYKINESILSEGIEEIKRYFPKIDEEKIAELIALDPTYKGGEQLGKYGKWILVLYNRGKLKEEDFYKVTEYLTTFKDNLSKIQNKDIMSYKSLQDLVTIIRPFEGQQDVSKKEEIRLLKTKEADKIYEDDNYIVIVPLTERASCYYGANTKWCTAAKTQNNMFDHYNDKGKLFIIINKKSGKKYQFHFETLSFMTELDTPIEPVTVIHKSDDLIDFFKTYIIDNIENIIDGYNDSDTEQRIYLSIDKTNMDICLGGSNEVFYHLLHTDDPDVIFDVNDLIDFAIGYSPSNEYWKTVLKNYTKYNERFNDRLKEYMIHYTGKDDYLDLLNDNNYFYSLNRDLSNLMYSDYLDKLYKTIKEYCDFQNLEWEDYNYFYTNIDRGDVIDSIIFNGEINPYHFYSLEAYNNSESSIDYSEIEKEFVKKMEKIILQSIRDWSISDKQSELSFDKAN